MNVSIGINPHWYSQFWIKQFWWLYQKGEIRLRPLLTKLNPPYCFYFEVNGEPYLIDVSDSKDLYQAASSYRLYFKANYDPNKDYPSNVRSSINGTTLKKCNIPGKKSDQEYDIVWIGGISGGRLHKIAMLKAIASLPLKMKLVAKMVTSEDDQRWRKELEAAGVEVQIKSMPYKQWLRWNKKGKWNILMRGKHDCLSFKMIDYCSIGAAVLADYPPTSYWPNPVQEDVNYLNFGYSGPMSNELSKSELISLQDEYMKNTWALLPKIKDETIRQSIAMNNLSYFQRYVANGQAAHDILQVISSQN